MHLIKVSTIISVMISDIGKLIFILRFRGSYVEGLIRHHQDSINRFNLKLYSHLSFRLFHLTSFLRSKRKFIGNCIHKEKFLLAAT